MTYVKGQMLRDENNNLLLQVYDDALEEFIPVTIDDIGSLADIKDILSGQASITLTPTVNIGSSVAVNNFPTEQPVVNKTGEVLNVSDNYVLSELLSVNVALDSAVQLLEDIEEKIGNFILQEVLTNEDAVELEVTFEENINVIGIYHEEDEWQEFVVNGIVLTIPSGHYITKIGGIKGKIVRVPEDVSCIISRLE